MYMYMSMFERNGDAFKKYFSRFDLTVHTVTAADGTLQGFAISGADTRSKLFLYELHVDQELQGLGAGRALVDLTERSGTSRGRGSVMIELNVHASNVDAIGFYDHLGFAETGRTHDGLSLVMQRARA